jgi:hypothetical protein
MILSGTHHTSTSHAISFKIETIVSLAGLHRGQLLRLNAGCLREGFARD